MVRTLVLMGSGETTPTMVTPHQHILAAAGDGERLVLDTPYGFQENADELSARTIEYFARNVGEDVTVASLRDAAATGTVAAEVVAARVAEAAWVFAGPGSPTYFARQLRATPVPDALVRRLVDASRSSATILASAAACTAGRVTIPVYELYKVGEAPHWHDGLDLLRPLGLDAVVVPHYDNSEGGTHDTSCCYVGDRRLRTLEEMLDPGTWVLGVDEHTAAVVDLDARELRVEGRGRVVLRFRGAEHPLPTGSCTALDTVLDVVTTLGATLGATLGPTLGAHPAGDAVQDAGRAEEESEAFARAVDRGDLVGAAEVTVRRIATLTGSDGSLQALVVREVATLARIAQAGLHEHRGLVAPHVELLLDLRSAARAERRFADADAIRDALVAAGIEVRDGAGATAWGFTDPLDAARAGGTGPAGG